MGNTTFVILLAKTKKGGGNEKNKNPKVNPHPWHERERERFVCQVSQCFEEVVAQPAAVVRQLGVPKVHASLVSGAWVRALGRGVHSKFGVFKTRSHHGGNHVQHAFARKQTQLTSAFSQLCIVYAEFSLFFMTCFVLISDVMKVIQAYFGNALDVRTQGLIVWPTWQHPKAVWALCC